MIYSSVVILARAVIITDCKAIVKMIMALTRTSTQGTIESSEYCIDLLSHKVNLDLRSEPV